MTVVGTLRQSPSHATASHIVAWAVLLVVVLWLSLRGWGSFQLGVYQDDGVYTVLARSLAFGDQYGLINQPGPPPPPKFGFGFPLLLAPVAKLFPHTMEGLSAVSLAATLLNVSLLFWGWHALSPTTSRWWGLATASLYGLSPNTIGGTRMVMSEPVFTSFALAGVLLAERCCGRGRAGRWAPVALGIVLALTMFTRTIGVALALAALLRLTIANRARCLPLVLLAGVGAVACVLVVTPIEVRHLLPWEYLNELHAGAGETSARPRAESLLDQAVRVSSGYITQEIRRSVFVIGSGEREHALAAHLGVPRAPEVVGATIAAGAVIGGWQSLQAQALCPTALLFEVLYFGVLAIWPWSSVRFLYPIQPLLSFQFLLGVAWVGSRLARRAKSRTAGPRIATATAAAAYALLVLLSAWKSLGVEDSRRFTRDLTVGTTWLAANSAADAIVMARYPEDVYLYSGRHTVDAQLAPSAESFDRLLDQERIDYLLVGPALSWSPAGAIQYADVDRSLLALATALASRGRLDLVYASDPQQKVLVFRVNHARSAHD